MSLLCQFCNKSATRFACACATAMHPYCLDKHRIEHPECTQICGRCHYIYETEDRGLPETHSRFHHVSSTICIWCYVSGAAVNTICSCIAAFGLCFSGILLAYPTTGVQVSAVLSLFLIAECVGFVLLFRLDIFFPKLHLLMRLVLALILGSIFFIPLIAIRISSKIRSEYDYIKRVRYVNDHPVAMNNAPIQLRIA